MSTPDNTLTTTKWIPIGPAPVQNPGPGSGGNAGCVKRAVADLTTGNCLTGGPPAVGDPEVVTCLNQLHVCYRDENGLIQDAWNDGAWKLQQLTGSGGLTNGPGASGDPRVAIYNNQMHVCYRDRADLMQDAWRDNTSNQWFLQQLNGAGGLTNAPAAEGNPGTASYLIGFSNQMHVCYLTPDGFTFGNGVIQDIWYDAVSGQWNQRQLTWTGGVTNGPVGEGNPAVVSYNSQMHVCYRDGTGLIQDVFYEGAVGQWYLQQLTGSGGRTNGPLAAGDPTVSTYNNQMHVCYRDHAGLIQDSFYDGASGQWFQQQLNGSGGRTNFPLAAGDPEVVIYIGQMHVCYRDANGWIQDAWYNGRWNAQQLTGSGGLTNGPESAGDPGLAVFNDQMHVCYRDLHGMIQDAFYDGAANRWYLQQIAGNPEVIYLAAAGGGVWKAVVENIPPAWTPLTDTASSLVFNACHTIAVHPGDNQLLLAAVSGPGSGILKSTNAGTTWETLGTQFDNVSISALAVHPTNPQILYAAVNFWGGLYQSTTGGVSVWQQLTGGLPTMGVTDVILARSNPQILYAGVAGNTGSSVGLNGVYRSSNGGATWEQLTGAVPATALGGWVRLESGLASGVVYAAFLTLPAGPPFVCVYEQQQHIAYCDSAGTMWDAWWNGNWNLQQITCIGGLLSWGPASAGQPFVCVFGQQQHFAYLDYNGTIWDAYYDSTTSNWSLRQINATGGLTPGGPAAAGGPFLWVYGAQLHFTYYDANGTIWDSWFDSSSDNWYLQQINTPSGVTTVGQTTGVAAASEPFVCVFDQQQHVAYRDMNGTVWDAWYDSPSNNWYLQQINATGGLTPNGPASVGQPFLWVYNQQQHFTYYDANGTIWDSWYDSSSNGWSLQQINTPAGVSTLGHTNGLAAASEPFVCVFNQRQHFVYRDNGSENSWHPNLWDAWYDPSSSQWNIQLINNGGLTSGNQAAGSPFVWVYNQQQHFTYQDDGQTIWDAWYDGPSNSWFLQQIHNAVQRFKSSDAGATWQALAYTPGSTENRTWHFLLAVDPQNDQHIIVNDAYKLFESKDAGNTWSRYDPLAPNSNPEDTSFDWVDLTFDAAGNSLATADQGIFLYTRQTAQWQSLIGDLQITTFYTVTVSGQSVYGIAQDQYSAMGFNLAEGQIAWQYLNCGGETGKVLRAVSSDYVYLYNPLDGNGNLVWRALRPPGGSWEAIYTNPIFGQGNYGAAYGTQKAFVMDPSNAQRLLLGAFQVYETTNATATTPVWNPISNVLSNNQFIVALAVAPSDGNTIYASTADGNVWVTANNGGIWSSCSSGLPATSSSQVVDLRVDPNNPSHVFAVTNSPWGAPTYPASFPNLWEMTAGVEGGGTWANISEQNVAAVSEVNVNAYTVFVDWQYAIPCLFAGTDLGVYVSVDDGANWNNFVFDLPNVCVRDLQGDAWNTPSTNLLVAATYGRGAWAILIAPSTISGTVYGSFAGLFNPPSGTVLADVSVFLDYNGSGDPKQSVFHTLTDVNGNFTFSNVPPGTYTVLQTVPKSYAQISSNPSPIVANGSKVTGIVFVDEPVAQGQYLRGGGSLRTPSAPGEWQEMESVNLRASKNK